MADETPFHIGEAPGGWACIVNAAREVAFCHRRGGQTVTAACPGNDARPTSFPFGGDWEVRVRQHVGEHETESILCRVTSRRAALDVLLSCLQVLSDRELGDGFVSPKVLAERLDVPCEVEVTPPLAPAG